MSGQSDHAEIAAALNEMGLMREGEQFALTALGGGVSCDVWRVDMGDRSLCVKRALPKLRVAADWQAPVERSHSEVEWMRLVASLDPKLVPEVLGEDRARHLFVMPFYPPDRYPVWKSQLAAGQIDEHFAALLGQALARIHAATANCHDTATRFANNAQFYALRLEPYLLYTAAKHPGVARCIRAISDGVSSARIALMHGDFSPKNILCGPDGPMILDAETACYGDPAFDFAFCLNHLMLKCVWHPEYRDAYLRAFATFRDAYVDGATWEDRAALIARTGPLLAALMLARIDGKSPVEYLTHERERDFVRQAALTFLRDGMSPNEMLGAWQKRLETEFGK